MNPAIVPAVTEHILAIVANIREADRQELWAARMETPERALTSSLEESSIAWTGTIDNEPVCMFGVAFSSAFGYTGHPWMIGTTHLEEHSHTFLRRCKGCVEQMKAECRYLENYVDLRNETAIKWLIWLGFELWIPPVPMGPFGLPFVHFTMRGTHD